MEKPEWKAVVDALAEKHTARVISYTGELETALPSLKETFPKYTCFVARPEETGFKQIARIYRMTRKLDDDPYGDTIFGVITGYTTEDALRLARATAPTVVSTALITAGVGNERYQESFYISDGRPGEFGWKKPDGTTGKDNQGKVDQTRRYIEQFERLDPDVIVSSGHASERNLEMPFSTGNIICKDGKLFGYITRERMIDESGQAKKERIEGELIPIREPKRPKLYLPIGNCLIGDIPDRNCMALAWLGHGLVNQMIGYTDTTWFGAMGWGTMRYWEQMGGVAPLNESLFFTNQHLLNRLLVQFPKTAGLDFDLSKKQNIQTIGGGIVQTMTPEERSKPLDQAAIRENMGLLWDRDVVAFYGDPALEIRLDSKYATSQRSVEFFQDKRDLYRVVVHAHIRIMGYRTGIAHRWSFLSRTSRSAEVLRGAEYKPVITDNFLLVTAPGPWKAGEDYTIEFRATPLP
jgi:zinc protease